MGISCAPRIFTKIVKPVFSVLHQMGFQSTSYIDDSLLVGDSILGDIINTTDMTVTLPLEKNI